MRFAAGFMGWIQHAAGNSGSNKTGQSPEYLKTTVGKQDANQYEHNGYHVGQTANYFVQKFFLFLHFIGRFYLII